MASPTTMASDAQKVVSWLRSKVGTQGYARQCLKLARSAWGAPGLGGTAAQAWNRIPSGKRHSDRNPPIGAPVWFTGGRTGAGHVAIVSKYVNGVPYIITNDWPKTGVVGEVALPELEAKWGNLKYVGWSNNINNTNILTGQHIPVGDGGIDVADTGSGPSRQEQQDAVFDYIEENFGLTAALLDMDKTDPKKGFTLREAFAQIRRQKITDPKRAAEILRKTNWFKTYGVDVTRRLQEEATKSGTFKEEFNASLAGLKDMLAAKGISLSVEDRRKLARDIYIYGLNTAQVLDRALAAKSAKFTGGGEVGADLASLDSLAYANGVRISATDRASWQAAIARGDRTVQDYVTTIRNQAAAKYSVFGEQIKAGEDLSNLVSPYKQIASELLEVSDGDIDWDDPLFKDGRAFQKVGADGKMTAKPLWEFRKEVMADRRWQYTRNARETYTDFGAQVLKRFGMVA